jgi:energy-coupling factor transport system permease protein
MQLLTPLVPDPTAPLARANPVAKLGAALVLMAGMFVSLDGVTALVVLAVLLGLLPFSGLPVPTLLGRARLLGFAAASVFLANILLAAEQAGPTLLAIGPLRIGADTAVSAAGLGLRILAIAGAGVLATATSQPTDLADALVQQLRLPSRFAIGTLAAMRLLPLMSREWQTIGMARRARGVDAGRNPLAAAGLFGGRLLALLVGAVRRGSRMAMAMEARGFGVGRCRTSARPQRMQRTDWALLLGSAVVAGVAIAVSVALGTWRPLFG